MNCINKNIVIFILLLSFSQLISGQDLPLKSDVLEIIRKVNDYWQSNNLDPGRAFWDNAAYHTGNMEAWSVTGIDRYLEYSVSWGEINEWKGAKSDNKSAWRYDYGETDEHVLFGDWQICFQTYIDIYNIRGDQRMIARAVEVMEYQMQTQNKDYWWWADGLYMVMPVMTKLYKLTKSKLYLQKLDEYFSYAVGIMYDEETGLFFRDAKYVYPNHTTANGKKDFWARGNGWVFAGLAKVINDLPSDYSNRNIYLDIFQKMAETLADVQQAEGYWTRSLLDPQHAPGYETSGTAFFTYGYLWGLNNGILENDKYWAIAYKSWEYLTETALQSSGRVGYVQPIGEKAEPGQVVDKNSTSNFGAGAFLLACCEMAKAAPGSMPLFITSVKRLDNNILMVKFNQKVDKTSAINPSNYEIDNIKIEDALISIDSSSVKLSLSDISPGRYEIRAKNIRNYSGEMIRQNESFSFVYSYLIDVTAKSYEHGTLNIPQNTLDFNLATRWSADGDGQWIMYDLNETEKVNSVDIAFYRGDERSGFFSVELSVDREVFTEVYRGQSSGRTVETENYSFTPADARFVRITGYGNSENSWNSITEVKINTDAVKVRSKVSGFKNNQQFRIYSGSDILTVYYPFKADGKINLKVYDLRGKLLLDRLADINNSNTEIKNIKLSTGMYYGIINNNETANFRVIRR